MEYAGRSYSCDGGLAGTAGRVRSGVTIGYVPVDHELWRHAAVFFANHRSQTLFRVGQVIELPAALSSSTMVNSNILSAKLRVDSLM
jgi:hypothetical protein